jgi:threonine synthase
VNTSQITTIEVRCSNCLRAYPPQGTPYRCPTCSGFFDFKALLPFDPDRVEPSQPGIWRFRHALGLAGSAPLVTLGEGNTPLIWQEAFGRQIAFKLEFLNPTGSFKDRGSAALVSFLRSRGVREAVEDSSGNAGASFAAYATAAGLKARVFVPDYASGPKRAQIEAYNAEVVRILGSRTKTSEATLRVVDNGAVYASHAFMPHGLAGYATIAFELYQQLGGEAGTIITPAGQGGLLLGIGRGFAALKVAGLIERMPAMVGVQALACAPLWSLFTYGGAGLSLVVEGETLAEGVRVRQPVRGDAVLQMVRETHGQLIAVDEPDILPGRRALARMGLYVEPTSAIVWNALEQIGSQLVEPVVVILTGTGLKSLG